MAEQALKAVNRWHPKIIWNSWSIGTILLLTRPTQWTTPNHSRQNVCCVTERRKSATQTAPRTIWNATWRYIWLYFFWPRLIDFPSQKSYHTYHYQAKAKTETSSGRKRKGQGHANSTSDFWMNTVDNSAARSATYSCLKLPAKNIISGHILTSDQRLFSTMLRAPKINNINLVFYI